MNTLSLTLSASLSIPSACPSVVTAKGRMVDESNSENVSKNGNENVSRAQA